MIVCGAEKNFGGTVISSYVMPPPNREPLGHPMRRWLPIRWSQHVGWGGQSFSRGDKHPLCMNGTILWLLSSVWNNKPILPFDLETEDVILKGTA